MPNCRDVSEGGDIPPVGEDLPLLRDLDQNGIDPESNAETAWRCRMCGYAHYGAEAPEECPYFFFPQTAFKKVWPRD